MKAKNILLITFLFSVANCAFSQLREIRLHSGIFEQIPFIIDAETQEKTGEMQTDEEKKSQIQICNRAENEKTVNQYFVALTGLADVIIYDVLGNIIFLKQCTFQEGCCHDIELNLNQKGIYFLHVSNGTKSITKKIMVE